ncbi:MAG: DUF2156 domain-containing protein [Deltaproteobacteria bacterium]|nr:DUF2156 domain-containing protein [Deltaproteobacteria bacterium]TLN04551.1 MAG: DUF2156 domain-containing protein [bacterium]
MEIPDYPSSRPVELLDKSLFDSLFLLLQPRISELTFANLYLFRHAHLYRLTKIGTSLVVFGCGYSGEKYFLPPLGGDVGIALNTLFSNGHVLYGADDGFRVAYLQGLGLDSIEDRDAFDYVYCRNDLATLSGNRYHKKKNRVNYFSSRHSFTVDRYSAGYREDTLALLEEWRRIRVGHDNRSLELEVAAAAEGLERAEQLGLEGVVVLVEGRVKAYALGERMNARTSVCHFEKADPFLDGLYQVVDQEFNCRCFIDCELVNREQDLGEPSLRKSKLSYHPIELVKKYRFWKTKQQSSGSFRNGAIHQ